MKNVKNGGREEKEKTQKITKRVSDRWGCLNEGKG